MALLLPTVLTIAAGKRVAVGSVTSLCDGGRESG